MVICTPQGGGGDPVVLRKVHRYQVAGLVHRQGERETNHWRPTLWPNAVMGSRVARVKVFDRGRREGQDTSVGIEQRANFNRVGGRGTVGGIPGPCPHWTAHARSQRENQFCETDEFWYTTTGPGSV